MNAEHLLIFFDRPGRFKNLWQALKAGGLRLAYADNEGSAKDLCEKESPKKRPVLLFASDFVSEDALGTLRNLRKHISFHAIICLSGNRDPKFLASLIREGVRHSVFSESDVETITMRLRKTLDAVCPNLSWADGGKPESSASLPEGTSYQELRERLTKKYKTPEESETVETEPDFGESFENIFPFPGADQSGEQTRFDTKPPTTPEVDEASLSQLSKEALVARFLVEQKSKRELTKHNQRLEAQLKSLRKDFDEREAYLEKCEQYLIERSASMEVRQAELDQMADDLKKSSGTDG